MTSYQSTDRTVEVKCKMFATKHSSNFERDLFDYKSRNIAKGILVSMHFSFQTYKKQAISNEILPV